VLAGSQLVGAVLLILAGRWSDRAGRRLRPLRVLGHAGAASLLLVALAADAPLTLLVPATVVAGAVSLCWVALSSAAAGEAAGPGRSGAAMGLQQAMMAVAATVSPIGFGALLGASSWALAFAAAAACPFLGALLLSGMTEPRVSGR
jgi:MFS family permease